MDIVLIAGLWLDDSAWSQVVPVLEARGHRPRTVPLPGQGDGRAGATLDDQLAAVLAAVDASSSPLVVGHSAAATLAWLAADRRADAVAGLGFVGGWPAADGEPYAELAPIADGAMPFPGWAVFEGPDSADLDDEARASFSARAIPVPEGVARGEVRYTDERRLELPVVLVCPEFSPDDARQWLAAGQLPELARARHLQLVDLESGHWPMLTAPRAFGDLLADTADGLAGSR